MFLRRVPWVVVMVISASPTARAQEQPLGLRFGMTATELKLAVPGLEVNEYGPMGYRASTAPQPYPQFNMYLFVVSPTVGLCHIRALSRQFPNDSTGSQTRAAFQQAKRLLMERYGTPSEFDLLKAGSVWQAENAWLMGIFMEERVYVAYWVGVGGLESPIDTSLRNVSLQASALPPSEGYLTLSYEGTNFPACRAEMRAADEGR